MRGPQPPALGHARPPGDGLRRVRGQARERPFDEHEWTYVRKDGSRLDVNLVIAAVRGANGTITGYLGVATDITTRKGLETALRLNNEELAEQTRRAEDANRAKSEFLAAMIGAIRTPMNAILGMANLLWTRAGRGPAAVRRHLPVPARTC